MSVDAIRVTPGKISDKPGFDTTDVEIDLAAGQTHGSVRMAHGPRTDRPLKRWGVVCGLDRVGPNSRLLNVPGPVTLSVGLAYADLPGDPPDGDYLVNVYDSTNGAWE